MQPTLQQWRPNQSHDLRQDTDANIPKGSRMDSGYGSEDCQSPLGNVQIGFVQKGRHLGSNVLQEVDVKNVVIVLYQAVEKL